MQGLMMDYQLNVPAILRRGDELFGDQRDRRPGCPTRAGTATRTPTSPRARSGSRLRCAKLGLEDGDRVGDVMWNHHEHLEAYFGVPVGGFVTHTLNLRLHPDDIAYIATHAGDRVLVVDKVLWPLVEKFVDRVGFEHVIVVGDGRDARRRDRVRGAARRARTQSAFAYRDIDERSAAAMCYTSGTTGQAEGRRLLAPRDRDPLAPRRRSSSLGIDEADTCCRSCRCSTPTRGACRSPARWSARSRCFPGPHLDPASLLDAFESEKRHGRRRRADDLDRHPAGARRRARRLGSVVAAQMIVGGSAAPRAMIEAFGSATGCTSSTRGA